MAALSVRSAFNVRELADTKYARFERPVLEDAPPPVAARQLLLRRGGTRCASLASAATAFVAAAAGRDDGARCRSDRRFDEFDIVVLRRGRRRGAELRERAAPRGSRSGANCHDCSSRLA